MRLKISEYLDGYCEQLDADENWAHKALLLLDEANALVHHAACSMTDIAKYEKAATAFWDVAKLLAVERTRLHKPETVIAWTSDPDPYTVGTICDGKLITRTKLYGSLWCVWGR